MCTAATFLSDDFYFGRNLDYEFSYGDEVTVTPRGYAFSLRRGDTFRTRYAIIGMAYVQGDYPLYYDAINEKGLGVAGLNFVGNAVYHSAQADRDNIAQFELIPWLLGQCATLNEARTLIERMNLLNEPFSPQLPLAQLHWLIADRTGSITVESHRRRAAHLRQPCRRAGQQSAFPHAALLAEQLHGAFSPIAEKHFCARCSA